MPTNVRAATNERKVYMVEVSSVFVLNQRLIQELLTKNCQVLSVELAQDQPQRSLNSVDDCVKAIIRCGYRALARAYHPDLGGAADKMVLINRAKKELEDLLQEVA